jgi:nitrate/nitrite transport system ATP-binding protein
MEIQRDLNNTVIMITHDVDEAVLLSDRIVMMTNGPAATIGEVLDIKLERPRDRVAMAESPAYNRYRQAVLQFLYRKQRNPADLKRVAKATESDNDPEEQSASAAA